MSTPMAMHGMIPLQWIPQNALVINLLLHLPHINVSHGIMTVKDACNFFQSRAFCLDVEEVDERKLQAVPDGVEEGEVPVVGEVVPG